MTGPNPDSFERAVNTFKKSLSPSLARQFSICELQDVKNVVRSIQHQQGEDRRLRDMRRLGAFVEAMEQFSKVIEVFLNVNEFVCFIWGPIKFLLGIARTHLDSFDKLLDAYSQIGDAIPGLLAYKATFERHSTLAAVLEDYYSDILRFHQEALCVFNRSRWKNFLHASWKTFDSKFSPILHSLESRRKLLESEKTSASLYEIQSLRENIDKVYKEQTRQAIEMNYEKHMSRINLIKQRLRAPDYQLCQEISSEDRSGTISGQWIFKNARFLSWSDKTSPGHEVLYINGIPGAGKTTLISIIIEKLLNEVQSEGGSTCSPVAYFYFKHGQNDKNTQNACLRAVLAQLLDQDTAISHHAYEDLSYVAEENLRSTKTLETHIKNALGSYQVSFLVLDGLDECDSEEAEKTVKWLLSLVNGGLGTPSASLRIIFSGQRDGVLDKLLANQQSIALESSEHLKDVFQYCQTFCKRIQAKFKTSRAVEQEILELVAGEAKGMFLYARVVLENLLHQTSTWRLKREIQPETFPRGLDSAYDRVIARVVEHASQAEREDATRVLSLVICAKRPLRWREIQAFFCISPEGGEIDHDRFLQLNCKELCGSLLDAHHAYDNAAGPEDIIQIVHETAKMYLIKRELLDKSLENAKLSIFCTQYLSSGPFGVALEVDDVVSHAAQGYYSLQDYAVQYWFEHLQTCVENSQAIDPVFFETCIDSAKSFLDSYCLKDKMDNLYHTASRSQVVKTIKSFPKNGRERNSCLNIELRAALIRDRIAMLKHEILTSEAKRMLGNLHGLIDKYKCPKPWCELFKGGIETAEKWKQHVNHHDLPFYCPSEGCFAAKLGFASESSLKQHRKDHHDDKGDQLHFPRIQIQKKSSLCSAAEKGNLEAVENALNSGEDINQTSKPSGSLTPLFLAARNGHVQVCELLISRGADIVTRFGERWSGRKRTSALEAAASAGRAGVVSLLIDRYPDDVEIGSPLVEAAQKGHLDVARVLLHSGKIDCYADENKLVLLNAVASGNETLVQYLLQNGFDYQANESCVIAAIRTISSHATLDLLLSTGRPVITSSFTIEKCLDASWLSLAKMLTSYPKLRLCRSDLQECLRKAEKEGFGEVRDAIRALIPTRLGDLDYDNLPSSAKKSGDDWYAIFNDRVPRRLDVDLVHTLAHESVVTCVGFSYDGKYVATGCDISTQIYDAQSGEQLCVLRDGPSFFGVSGENLIRSLCFSPDGKYLATGAEDRLVRVWDIQDRVVRNRFSGHEADVYSLDFASDGRTIASGGEDKTIRLWDIESGTNMLTLTVENHVSTVAISPDTKSVAAGLHDNSIRIWDIHQGSELDRLEGLDGHKDVVYDIAFAPNGKDLVSGGLDKLIKMWELSTPQGLGLPNASRCVKTFEGHHDFVVSVALTPDAAWVLSGSKDRSVQFWDPRTCEPQLLLKGHQDTVMSVAASPTGRYFATGSGDKRARIWSYRSV